MGRSTQKIGTISPADRAALKAPDVLHAYCRAALGAGKQVGRLTFYPCPWGAHTRPKLEVTERDGVGVAMCRACDKGGTVFDVAAGVLGLDARKDFAAVVQGVADAVGYVLRDDDTGTPQKTHRKRKAGFSRPLGVVAPPASVTPAEKPLEHLPADEEAALPVMRTRKRDMPPCWACRWTCCNTTPAYRNPRRWACWGWMSAGGYCMCTLTAPPPVNRCAWWA